MPKPARFLSIVRDAWLIIGVSLLLLLVLEGAYRAQGAIRRALRNQPDNHSPVHPYYGQAWWNEYMHRGTWTNHYDPYRGHAPNPTAGEFITIDSLGRRATVDPAAGSVKRVTLVLLGGSTMWGYLVRDRYTIASQVAAELHQRGIDDVAVVSLAQAAYNATQGFNTLVLELRRGNVPDLVVSMDGNNEIASAFQLGRPGAVLNEPRMNERMFGQVSLLRRIARQFKLVQRLRPLRVRRDAPLGDPSLCPDVATYYRRIVELTMSLARTYGFRAAFLWQPMIANSQKPLTEWEASMWAPEGWPDMVRACTRTVDSTMADAGIASYHSLSGIFDEVETTVFLDHYGHLTEDANGIVARRVVDLVLPDLLARIGSSNSAPGLQ